MKNNPMFDETDTEIRNNQRVVYLVVSCCLMVGLMIGRIFQASLASFSLRDALFWGGIVFVSILIFAILEAILDWDNFLETFLLKFIIGVIIPTSFIAGALGISLGIEI